MSFRCQTFGQMADLFNFFNAFQFQNSASFYEKSP